MNGRMGRMGSPSRAHGPEGTRLVSPSHGDYLEGVAPQELGDSP
jgi:hypothetical protein